MIKWLKFLEHVLDKIETRIFLIRMAVMRLYTPDGCFPNPRDERCTCPRPALVHIYRHPADIDPSCPVEAHRFTSRVS